MAELLHVLLVDNDVKSLLDTAKLLEINLYKVTAIQLASVAMAVLAKRKVKYDVVMIDVNLSDVQGFQLLHDAINMDLLVILMSDQPNQTLVRCAIEEGAFMFIEKPANMDVLKYLWQHVLRENTLKGRRNGRFGGLMASDDMSRHGKGIGTGCSNHIPIGDQYESSGDMAGVEDPDGGSVDKVFGKCPGPKKYAEWTQELHEKFVDAVEELGEGKCFPRTILELMDVPGLKRMQVASHLQKCRKGWKPPQERQGNRSKSSRNSAGSVLQHSISKKYGTYPRIARGAQPQFLHRKKDCKQQGEDADSNVLIYSSVENPMLHPPDHSDREILIDYDHHVLKSNINGDNACIGVDGSEVGLDERIKMDFGFEEFDFDHMFSPQMSTSNVAEIDEEDHEGFWTSFISNLERDFGSKD